eukprot:gb/GECG01004388.1/.p1 GENE.gb/GECG01004388.1/~~gb/GECG01004388.1/.p1  ORF type:complete len:247 (+),score=17.90 gb/GECG01004388.1/:1-741(+)
MRINTDVGEPSPHGTAASPSDPNSQGSHAIPSIRSSPRGSGSPRVSRKTQLAEEAKLMAVTGISVKYSGSSLSPKREFDNRGLSTFQGPYHHQYERPFHAQYRRTVQQAFEYTQKTSPRHAMGYPMTDRNPFRGHESEKDAPGPGDYQRTAEKASKALRRRAPVTKLPPLRNFHQAPGPANYNSGASRDWLGVRSPRTIMHLESGQDLRWGKKLSPRMQWILPYGASLQSDFNDKAHLGPGRHSPK